MRERLTGAVYYLGVAVVTVVLMVPLLHLFSASLGVPLSYRGDALAGATHVKAVVEHGWYGLVPDVGAPEGRHGNDFLLPDNLHLLVMSAMGLVTDRWAVVMNLYFLSGFPLAAVAAAWFFRVVGLSRLVAGALGVLYAFLPYHLYRDEDHLFLSAYWVVPLGAVLIHRALVGERLWNRWTPVLLVVLGTASSYYSLFALYLLLVAGVVAVVPSRDWRRLGGVVAAQGLLLAVMVANTLPNALYERAHGSNLAALVRSPRLTENSSFKLSSLLLPSPHHRVGALADLRQDYDRTFPLPSEEPVLGIVAAVGFVVLLVVLLLGRSDRWVEQRRLATLSLAAFLLGSVGGLSTFFALFVTDSVRGWNRISVYLALFCLASVGLLLQRAHVLVVGLVVVVGLLDSVPADYPYDRAAALDRWGSDRAFVAQVEQLLPDEAMVLQLPYLPYPESSARGEVEDSEPFRMSLHSTTLRWSYGGFKGRPEADWQLAYAAEPVARQVSLAVAAGFAGVEVDLRGWPGDDGAAVEADLQELLGVAPLVSADGRFSFFDARAYADRLGASHPDLEVVGDHVLHHPVGYAVDLDSASPRIAFDNPRDGDVEVDATVSLVAPSRPDAVALRWPDGSTETVSGASGSLTATRRLVLPPGRSWLALQGPDGSTYRFRTVVLPDPVVDAFVP